jgi:hypothetical protein
MIWPEVYRSGAGKSARLDSRMWLVIVRTVPCNAANEF